MKTFKYKIIQHKVEMGEEKLNAFGRRGLELVAVVADEFGYKYYFKQEVVTNG